MQYVSPAGASAEQNIVACQYKTDIFFYTTKAVEPGQELFVWYCTEFAKRLEKPVVASRASPVMKRGKQKFYQSSINRFFVLWTLFDLKGCIDKFFFFKLAKHLYLFLLLLN